MKAPRDIAQAAIDEYVLSPDQWGISLSGTGSIYQLERKFARLVGHSYALSVANTTSGLWAAFTALDIHDADVITTPYTWGGSLSGLILAGNRPVFVDIDGRTLTLNPDEVARSVTSKTKAILAVDIYGYPCHGQRLREVADEYGLAIVQDCAQSFGAYIDGHHTGWWADAAVYSLTVGKALFAGEGGVVVTPDEEVFEKLVWHTQHPDRQLRDAPGMPVNELAMNLRIHPLAAVWAEASFESALAGVVERRETCLQVLGILARERLLESELPDEWIKPSFHRLIFRPRWGTERVEMFLHENGFMYKVCPPPITELIYHHEAYRQISRACGWERPDPCPVAESQCRSGLLLKSGIPPQALREVGPDSRGSVPREGS